MYLTELDLHSIQDSCRTPDSTSQRMVVSPSAQDEVISLNIPGCSSLMMRFQSVNTSMIYDVAPPFHLRMQGRVFRRSQPWRSRQRE